MCSWKCQQNFLLSPIRRSKPKFLNLKVFIDLARSIPTQFSPFCTWIFYTYKYEYFIRIYQYFSCLHSLHECLVTHNHYLPLPPRIKFFSCSSQRRKGINVIYHLTITAGFQLNRPGLEFKQTEAIVFFPQFAQQYQWKYGAGNVGGWTTTKRMRTQETCLYVPSISHTEFHTSHVPVKKAWNSQRIISEYQSDVKQNLNHKWYNYLHIIKSSHKLLHKLQIN